MRNAKEARIAKMKAIKPAIAPALPSKGAKYAFAL